MLRRAGGIDFPAKFAPLSTFCISHLLASVGNVQVISAFIFEKGKGKGRLTHSCSIWVSSTSMRGLVGLAPPDPPAPALLLRDTLLVLLLLAAEAASLASGVGGGRPDMTSVHPSASPAKEGKERNMKRRLREVEVLDAHARDEGLFICTRAPGSLAGECFFDDRASFKTPRDDLG